MPLVAESFKDYAIENVNKELVEGLESGRGSFNICVDNYICELTPDEDERVMEMVRVHLEDYFSNPELSEWKFERDLRPKYNLFFKFTNEKLKQEYDKEQERLSLEKREQERNEVANELNKDIDEKKANGYKGTINCTDRYENWIYEEYVIPNRNDFKKVNDGQYKIIYDNKSNNKISFEISSNMPFYEESEEFETKKLLKVFLMKAKKVHINSDMSFIPLRYKGDNKFYILITNNITEVIELYRLNSFNYLNKQHNVYYIIETNMDDKFSGNLNEFKKHVIKKCQKYINYNKTVLYNVYNKIGNFKTDNNIIKQYE